MKKGTNLPTNFSRRSFCKGFLGSIVSTMTGTLFLDYSQATTRHKITPHPFLSRVEPSANLKVLRWSAFVESEKDIWMQNTKQWEKVTGGRVETDFLPWTELSPQAALEAAIGSGHDVIIGQHDGPHLYPEKLLHLDDIATDLQKKYAGWYPICEKYGQDSEKKRWIALPMGVNGSCLIFRKSALQKAGYDTIPDSIDGFLSCCKALRKEKYYTGFALGHAVGDANTWTHWLLWSFGGKTIEKDGKTVAIYSKKTLDALEVAQQFYETMIPGCEEWTDIDNNKAFLNGDIAVTCNGSSVIYSAKKFNPGIYKDIETKNLPIGPVGYPTELSIVSLGYVFKHTRVPNAAKHFLSFMLEEEQYRKWLKKSFGYITHSLRSYYNSPSWMVDRTLTPYRECVSRMLPSGYAGPIGPQSAAAMGQYIVVDMFKNVCTRALSPKQAMLDAEKRLRHLYR